MHELTRDGSEKGDTVKTPVVSVIIVSYNTCDILRHCLASVYEQARDAAFEVVVIDNASSDGSAEMIQRQFQQVRLIANNVNRGFAAANNQGMAIARGRYVLLLNSDTLVLDQAIDNAVAFADEHGDVGIMGCRVLNADRTLQPTCFMYPSIVNMFFFAMSLNKMFPTSRLFGRERMTWWQRDDVRDVDVVTGCFMLVRRDAIDQVGLMDESFFMYGEETDWCYRFKEAGWRIMFAPCGEIVHLGGASTRRMAAEMKLQLKAGTLQFLRKHRGTTSYVVCCTLMGLFLLLRLPFWVIRAVVCRHDRHRSWSYVLTYAEGLRRLARGWRGLRGAAVTAAHDVAGVGRSRSSVKGVTT